MLSEPCDSQLCEQSHDDVASRRRLDVGRPDHDLPDHYRSRDAAPVARQFVCAADDACLPTYSRKHQPDRAEPRRHDHACGSPELVGEFR